MRTLRNLLILIMVMFSTIGKADIVPTPMHHLFFKSDLIVKSKIVSHTEHYYKIKILDVYRDHQIGIKVGDYIKIKKEMNVETSVDRVLFGHIENRLTGVAFLRKSEQGWRIRDFPFFYDGKVSIRFDYEYCEIKGTAIQVKTQIQEYFKEFKISNKKLIGKMTAKEVVKSNLNQLALTQYAQLYKFTIDEGIHEKLNCGIEEIVELEELIEAEGELPIIPCNLFMNESVPSFSQEELRTYLIENENPLQEIGVKGKVFLQLQINEVGKVTAVEVKRGIHPILDSIAIKKAYAMPDWLTGVDELGRKRKCYTVLPFHFRVKETE